MAYNQTKMIYKLRQAINAKGHKLLFNTTEFYSDAQQRPIAIYHIKDSVLDSQTGKYVNQELFSSPSHLQIVFFLRDYLFALEGKELPTDNEFWNEIRETRCMKFLPITVEEDE